MNTTTNRVVAVIIVIVLMVGEWWILTRPLVQSSSDTASSTDIAITVPSIPSDSSSDAAAPSKPVVPAAPSTADDTQATMISSGTKVAVADQPAGSSVSVSGITVTKPTWIAVVDSHDKILGARRFDENKDAGTIDLLRPTAAGTSYELYMYVDNGDNAFQAHKDMLVTDASGQPASVTFTAK